jgi:hypothetical protein
MTHKDVIPFLSLGGLSLERRPMKLAVSWSAKVSEVEGDYLVYEVASRIRRASPQGLLREFIEAKSSRESVILFCRKWGVLGLCNHGVPRAHGDCISIGAFRTRIANGVTLHYYRESIDSIQRFAGALESLLKIGASMAQGRPGSWQDWENACAVITDCDFAKWPENPSTMDVDAARLHLTIVVRRLIEICRIRPRFFWNAKTRSWQIDLDTEGLTINLPALLTIELLITIADKDGFALCSSCHRSYIPLRRPDPTRRNYCELCGRTAAMRDASRDFRKRNREEKQSERKHAKGKANG